MNQQPTEGQPERSLPLSFPMPPSFQPSALLMLLLAPDSPITLRMIRIPLWETRGTDKRPAPIGFTSGTAAEDAPSHVLTSAGVERASEHRRYGESTPGVK